MKELVGCAFPQAPWGRGEEKGSAHLGPQWDPRGKLDMSPWEFEGSKVDV